MSLTFEELPRMIHCRLEPESLQGIIGPSNIDTRLLNPGELFWALCGEQADGHDFIGDAFSQGAQAAVVNEAGYGRWKEVLPQAAFVVVEDTLKALQNLACAHRRCFDIPVLALTGSNGKTATKELIAAALALRYRVLKSQGNFNNHIGVPLTLLQITDQTELVLIEMGTNHPGDIALLSSIAAPTVGLVLNVGSAHLAGFGDEAAVAIEKGALLAALPLRGIAFINYNDPYVAQMTTPAQTRICYGFDGIIPINSCTSTFQAQDCGLTSDARGRFRFQGVDFTLSWYGRHQIRNALTAAVVAAYFQIPLPEVAATFAYLPPLIGRLQVESVAGLTLIDDSYNANPSSTAAALDFLAFLKIGGKKYVVLGDHLELGQFSAELHRSLGRMIVTHNVDGVFLIGSEIGQAKAEIADRLIYYQPDYSNLNEMIEQLLSTLKSGDALLVKASRGLALDRLIVALKKRLLEVHS